MERKAVSQLASRPFGVPQLSMKRAQQALAIVSFQRTKYCCLPEDIYQLCDEIHEFNVLVGEGGSRSDLPAEMDVCKPPVSILRNGQFPTNSPCNGLDKNEGRCNAEAILSTRRHRPSVSSPSHFNGFPSLLWSGLVAPRATTRQTYLPPDSNNGCSCACPRY